MKKADIETLITRWTEGGVVTPEQASRMRTDITEFSSGKSGDYFITSILIMGAFALSLGALLVIASNWALLGKATKVVMALSMPIIPLAFAYWQCVRKGVATIFGRAAAFFGVALIGGSLALVGQIYHLEMDLTSFLLQWFALSVPFIVVFKFPEVVLLGSVLGGAGFASYLVTLLEDLRDESAAVMVATTAALIYAYVTYRAGTLLRYAAAWESGGRMLRLWGGACAMVILFITTFKEYAQVVVGFEMYDYHGVYGGGDNYFSWVALSLALNFFFIGFLIFIILRAARYEEYSFAFWVVRIMGLYLIVKYLTLFSGMIDTGLFLMLGGVIFIVGGWLLERRKGSLMAYMKRGHIALSN